MWTAIIQNNSITIVINEIMFDPAKACFYGEDTFRSALVDEVVQDYGVS